MCQAIGKLKIYLEKPDGYLKGAIEKPNSRQAFYLPPSARMNLKVAVKSSNGKEVIAELVRGMIVQIQKL